MFRCLGVAVVACLSLVLSLGNAGIARAIPGNPITPTFGQVISMINHTDKEVASLNLLQTIPSGAIVVVPITKSVNPSDATPTALNNALVRNADGINALRQDLATITVSGDPACDGGVGCPSIGAYLVTQGVLLNTVIGAIPGNPVAPISTLNPLVIYVIPGNPV